MENKMIRALLASFKDVFSFKIRWLLILTLVLTGLVFAGLFYGFSILLPSVVTFESVWLTKTISFLGYIGFFILALMLFPAVATFISGFFIDWSMEKLSGKQVLRSVPLAESLKMSGVVALKGVAAGLLLGPVTLVLSWIPLLNFVPVVLFYWVNGRLLAREYFFAVALRSLTYAESQEKFNQNMFYWNKAGVMIAFLMTIPGVNMIGPLVAVAFMRRLFLEKEQEQTT